MRFVRFAAAGREPAWGRLEGSEIAVWSGAPWAGGREGTERLAADAVRLLAPAEPSKVLCVGLNYQEHRADRQGSDATLSTIIGSTMRDAAPQKDPILFLKAPSSIVGPGDPIRLPPGIGRVDYEAELVAVIGRRIYRPQSRAEAQAAIFGYTAANDVSAREVQQADVQWMRAKSYDSFCPLGPWIETELDPADLRIQGLLGGEVRQDARTSHLLADPAQVVWFAAQGMTLLPGDVLLTGTPSGLGGLSPGDVFTVRIEGLGDLRNPVATVEG